MRKTILIGDVPVPLKATAGTMIRYRNWFGRDLLSDLKKIPAKYEAGDDSITEDAFGVIVRLLYTMARQADSSVPDDLVDWLDQFDSFPIEDFGEEVVNFWASSLKSTSEQKNV